MAADPLYWSRRPLTAEMIGYAAQDVAALTEAATRMQSLLTAQTRAIVARRSEEYADQLRLLSNDQVHALCVCLFTERVRLCVCTACRT